MLLGTDLAWGQRLSLGKGDTYIHGINIPWRFYGNDFGSTGQRGYDPIFYDRLFERVANAGLNTVRMWIHCDGRNTPRRHSENSMAPPTPQFLEDLESFIDLASDHGLLVLPVLWTFEMVDGRVRQVLSDDELQQSYLDSFLKPMIVRLADKCNILAWEIINEPEWAMDIPFAGTTRRTVEPHLMQRFVANVAHVIHAHSDHWTTVGSAGIRFSTEAFPLTTNYWSDQALLRQGATCKSPILDFYSIHYYKWNFEALSPFGHRAKELQLDKPILISEFGLTDEHTGTLLSKALINGYAGTMPWSMMAGDSEGSWQDYEQALQDFAHEKKVLVEMPEPCLNGKKTPLGQCHIFPNPAMDHLSIESQIHSQVEVTLIDLLGRTVLSRLVQSDGTDALDLAGIASGTYLVRLVAPAERSHSVGHQTLIILDR
ncbi:MAG: T9SS type A sorting domain-containing protein [Saprospiraceae bacterium]|nr:T9SS type A sorting domain-containing protein [Saprospiraceae bacterium]